MTTLLCIAVGLLGGLLMTRILKRFNMPVITSYLIAGLLLGPFFIGRLGIPGLGFNTYEQVEGFGLISDIALGFIALTIGNEFRIEQLKKIGKQATIVGILQAVITTIIVDIALIIFHCIRPDVLSIPRRHYPRRYRRRYRTGRDLDGRPPVQGEGPHHRDPAACCGAG